MPIKGIISPDHVQLNKFDLRVIGLPPLVITAISGIEEELDMSDLPDRTKATGGRVKPVEFDITIPAHEIQSQISMESWYGETQDPVTPTHKKIGTLILFTQSNFPLRSFTLVGMMPRGRNLPDFEMENDGEMADVVWPMSADQIEPDLI